jgi:hypothetical protein
MVQVKDVAVRFEGQIVPDVLAQIQRANNASVWTFTPQHVLFYESIIQRKIREMIPLVPRKIEAKDPITIRDGAIEYHLKPAEFLPLGEDELPSAPLVIRGPYNGNLNWMPFAPRTREEGVEEGDPGVAYGNLANKATGDPGKQEGGKRKIRAGQLEASSILRRKTKKTKKTKKHMKKRRTHRR